MKEVIKFIDTHCYIEQDIFDSGRDVVIERDIKEGSGITSSALTEDI
ncbi:MAG: hypothetical protein ACFFDQ_11160 [Candidatus Thorarchaeota archaeon]